MWMIKQRVFTIISKADEDDKASRLFDILIMTLIFLSVAAIILRSFDDLAAKYGPLFYAFEVFCVGVFTVEYILRIWTADLLYPDAKRPRIKYMRSFMAVIDLLAILPFFLPFISADMRYIRALRLLHTTRLLRVFKLGRYIDALHIIVKVIKAQASQLIISMVICFFVMLFSSIIMYTVENPVQPEQFPNILASLWWAICTLTTVGYGDIYPITPLGRFFAAIISLVGIGVIAIPTGIIAAGFSAVINRENREDGPAKPRDRKKYCPYCGHRLDE